jgi:predicted  nucleic acid-binding Zn-ribbon protein
MQYDRLKKKHANGVVVAEAADGVCRGCRLQLRPQLLQDLRKSAQIMYCESCGRILYHDAPADQQARFEGGTRVSLS